MIWLDIGSLLCSQLVSRIKGNYVDMRIGYIGPDNCHVYVGFGKYLTEPLRYFFASRCDSMVGIVVEIPDKFCRMHLWNDEGMASVFWINIEIGKSFVIFVDFVTRYLAFDYFCKN